MSKCKKCNNLCCLVKTCELCDKEFTCRRNKINSARFCSRHCKSVNAGRVGVEILHTKWNLETQEQRSEKMKLVIDRFSTKTDTCWLWMGSKNKQKKKLHYGRASFRGTHPMAHRLSYEAYRGAIPKGMLVLHKCDTPPCVNPDHLFLGNHLDNHKDKMSKGRNVVERLDENKVREIKQLLSQGAKGAHLAKKFNVSPTNISNIKKGKIWNWVSK